MQSVAHFLRRTQCNVGFVFPALMCRCAGYSRIVDAIAASAKAES